MTGNSISEQSNFQNFLDRGHTPRPPSSLGSSVLNLSLCVYDTKTSSYATVSSFIDWFSAVDMYCEDDCYSLLDTKQNINKNCI